MVLYYNYYKQHFWLQQPHCVYKHLYKNRHPTERHCEFVALAFSNGASHFLPLSCKQAINTQEKKKKKNKPIHLGISKNFMMDLF